MGSSMEAGNFPRPDGEKMELTGPEKGRAHKLFTMMDVDNSKTVDIDEIVIVHDSDKAGTIAILDQDGNGVVDKDEWTNYLMIKKAQKAKEGPKKFEYFLNYLEAEIPKHIPELKIFNTKKKVKGPKTTPKQPKKRKQELVKPTELRAVAKVANTFPAVFKMPEPENITKKKARDENLAAAKAEADANARMARKYKRVEAYKNAENYCKEYRALAKQQVRMRRQAKAAGNHFVEAEAKLIFVVRIRGLADMHPKTKKILQLMRLRQMNMGVFMKVSKAATEMLKRVEPYLSYGYPTLKSVRDLLYKRGFGKVNKNRIALKDNSVIEGSLGKYGIKSMEDLVHEIYTVGPHFREANNFLWPFKLRPAKGGQPKKRKGYCEGGQAGNREENMNRLIQRML